MSDSADEIGTLVVVVLKARNLRDKHTFYKQDAYAQATLNKVTKKTQVDVKGGQHPVWDEELRFPVSKRVSDETRKLEVSCWSKEPRTDECVGKGSVDISDTLKTGEFDDWVPLQMEDGTYRGEIFLEMTYYAKTPPLQRRASKWKPTERLARPTTAYAYADVPPLPTAQSSRTRTDSTISDAVGRGGNSAPHAAHQQGTGTSQFSVTSTEQSHSVAAGAHRTPVHKHDALPPLPEEPAAAPEAIPAILRPGGGGRRTSMSPPRTSPRAGNGLLPPEHPLHTRAPVPPKDPSAPTQLPTESIPPYLRLGGGHTPIPEPHIPPPQTYVPPSQPYSPPAQSYIPPTQPPYVPPAQPATAPQPYGQAAAHTHTYPQQPYPPPQAYGPPPPLQPYGSPPRHYQPPAQAYIPPPVPPPAPSYPPYGYPPPPTRVAEDRDTDDLPDPYLQARYKSPLPLPNEPPGGRTPTASHHHSQLPAPPPTHPSLSTTRNTSPPPPSKGSHTALSTAATPRPAQAQTHSRGPSREERDRLLALQLEKEEEERQRKLREQEERDNELARQLDLELNLEQENAAREGREDGHIPGAW